MEARRPYLGHERSAPRIGKGVAARRHHSGIIRTAATATAPGSSVAAPPQLWSNHRREFSHLQVGLPGFFCAHFVDYNSAAHGGFDPASLWNFPSGERGNRTAASQGHSIVGFY